LKKNIANSLPKEGGTNSGRAISIRNTVTVPPERRLGFSMSKTLFCSLLKISYHLNRLNTGLIVFVFICLFVLLCQNQLFRHVSATWHSNFPQNLEDLLGDTGILHWTRKGCELIKANLCILKITICGSLLSKGNFKGRGIREGKGKG
jgi:hypothetical protein